MARFQLVPTVAFPTNRDILRPESESVQMRPIHWWTRARVSHRLPRRQPVLPPLAVIVANEPHNPMKCSGHHQGRGIPDLYLPIHLPISQNGSAG